MFDNGVSTVVVFITKTNNISVHPSTTGTYQMEQLIHLFDQDQFE